MKKGLLIVGAATLIAALVAGMVGYAPAQAEDAQWTASYWNNKKFSGKAVVTRKENLIGYNWGDGSPVPGKINKDGFSIRWKRNVNFVGGEYIFTYGSDDGIRVWIDDTKIIDQWKVQYYDVYTVKVDVSAGEHLIRVDYFENNGGASVSLSWAAVTDPPWSTQYFNGPRLKGKVIVARQESDIDYHWGTTRPAPDVKPNNFSARWVSRQYLVKDKYNFRVEVNGGFRLYVDNEIVRNEWYNHYKETIKIKVKIKTTGNYDVRLEYFNTSKPATIALKIKPW